MLTNPTLTCCANSVFPHGCFSLAPIVKDHFGDNLGVFAFGRPNDALREIRRFPPSEALELVMGVLLRFFTQASPDMHYVLNGFRSRGGVVSQPVTISAAATTSPN